MYKRRFTDLEGSEAGTKNINRLESAVHQSLEYLIPLVEFTKLQQMYLFVIEKRDEATSLGKGASSVMTVKYSHDPLGIYNR
jgi:hypothetical protein